jgi:hypothetical protein
MNRTSWLPLRLLIGCGGGAATMTVTFQEKVLLAAAIGQARLTISGTEETRDLERGLLNDTGQFPTPCMRKQWKV